LVDLAPVRDGDQVTPAVATVLKVKERPGEGLAVSVSDAQRDRHTNVLLDNGEHDVDVSDVLLELHADVDRRARRTWTCAESRRAPPFALGEYDPVAAVADDAHRRGS
jgi:predicted ATPase